MAHVVVLVLAGFASALVAAMLGDSTGLAAAVLFGVALAGYLSFFAGIGSHAALAGVIFTAPFSYIVVMILGSVAMTFFGIAAAILGQFGSIEVKLLGTAGMSVAGAVGTALLAGVFLQVLPSDRNQFPLEVASCAIVGGLAGALSRVATQGSVQSFAPVPTWTCAVGFAFGFVAHLRSAPAASGAAALRTLAGVGLARICVVLLVGDSLRATPLQVSEWEVRRDAELREAKTKWFDEAPPFVDTSASSAMSAQGMFLPEPIAGTACNPPKANLLPVRKRQIDSRQLKVPARHQYLLQCSPKGEGANSPEIVLVDIVQYPNEAWAQYELRFVEGDLGLPDSINLVTVAPNSTGGRPVFVIGKKALWASGDKTVVISGTVSFQLLDAFVNAYLEQHPNTLPVNFDLPTLPARLH